MKNAFFSFEPKGHSPIHFFSSGSNFVGVMKKHQMLKMSSTFSFDPAQSKNGEVRQLAKQKLLKLVSEVKREGYSPQPADNDAVIAAVEELERLNPCECPVESPLISGKWSLLYTGAADSAVTDSRRIKEGPIGATVTELSGASDTVRPADLPLGRRVTTLAGRLVRNRGNFQDIDAAAGRVVNRAALEVFGAPLGLRIEGRCWRDQADAADPALRAARLQVAFESVTLSLGANGPRVTVPLGWANGGRGPRGWVDTTYLDEDVRCGRGDKGSVFVTARRPE